MSYQPKIILLILFISSCLCLRAQYESDSSYNKVIAVYNRTIGINKHLFNGTEYIDYDHRTTGSPFFSNTYFTSGTVTYYGVFYNNVQIFYDELNDNAILKNYNDTPLVLVREKVASFSILGHQFVNLQVLESNPAIKDSGFYDMLYNGNVKLFAKRKKKIVQKISTLMSESYFNEKVSYYIFKNNTLYTVDNKNSVLEVLKDKKNAVSKFLHQSHIKYNRNPELAMTKMLAYYDSLNNTK